MFTYYIENVEENSVYFAHRLNINLMLFQSKRVMFILHHNR